MTHIRGEQEKQTATLRPVNIDTTLGYQCVKKEFLENFCFAPRSVE